MQSSRERIIEAAARVYAQHGFRGATTRRIADEAGVNEITVFRQFGSKDALIHEAVRRCSALDDLPALPDEPHDPEHELAAWARAYVAHLRARRAFIRKTMGELEERPEVAPCASATPLQAMARLQGYVARLRAHGFGADEGGAREREWDAAAIGMLMSALFSDAMGRDVMPAMYPVPAERAPAMYVRIFLRAVGVRGTRAAPDDGAALAPAPHGPEHGPPTTSRSTSKAK
jgi:AcrR family transcriptional regulator